MLNNLGIIEDPRTEDEKSQDFQHDELASGGPSEVSWGEKPVELWKSYSIRDQDGSYSCVGQGTSKALEVLLGQVVSAHPIYRRRSNFPEQGMWLQNAADIIRKQGTTTEALDVSQQIGEADMNRDVSVNTPIKAPGYVKVGLTMDALARALDAYYAVPIVIYSQIKTYTGIPTFDATKPVDFGHCVCIVDRFTYNGKNCFLIDDSWGHYHTATNSQEPTQIGNGSQRIFTEDFIMATIKDAIAFLPIKPEVNPVLKPKYTFTIPLQYGLMNNADVKALQAILTYENLFPGDTPFHTGNMLQMTCNALKKWQVAHGITDFANETDVRNVRFGQKSIDMANSLYSN